MDFSKLTLAYWCVLAAGLLPYLSAYIGKAGGFGAADNQQPREWLGRQQGWRSRAMAAQANGFEGLPLFIGAVLLAHQLGYNQARLDLLAMAYVILRMVYIGAYVAGLGTLRSAIWTLAFVANIGIFFIGA
ncbi:MAG: MAPEG family protein [Proteobacteria bacterium]|nr:MAPEG family protein [Pseudomonadota bacterium]